MVEGTANFTIELTFSADPIPSQGNFSWFFNGRKLLDGVDGIFLEVNSIRFELTGRRQAGTYRVESTNTAGVGGFEVQLTVLCR